MCFHSISSIKLIWCIHFVEVFVLTEIIWISNQFPIECAVHTNVMHSIRWILEYWYFLTCAASGSVRLLCAMKEMSFYPCETLCVSKKSFCLCILVLHTETCTFLCNLNKSINTNEFLQWNSIELFSWKNEKISANTLESINSSNWRAVCVEFVCCIVIVLIK